MGSTGQDLRFAFRTLRRTPGFTSVALVTLALGIGGTTAMFSVVDGLLLRDLPYPDSRQLVTLWEDHRAVGGPVDEWTSPATYRDWSVSATSLTGLAAVVDWAPNLFAGDQPLPAVGAGVSANYFEVLQGGIALGRTFSPEEDRPGAAPVVLLSHGLWQRAFGRDPLIVGTTIEVDGSPMTVVGITEKGFRGALIDAEIWRPLAAAVSPTCFDHRRCFTIRTVGRLAPGTAIAQATEELNLIAGRLADEHPASHRDVGATIIPLQERVVGGARPALLTLLGAMGFVLLMTCVNVASLLVTRASGRQAEMVIRSAIGAPRGRLVRQLITESVLLATLSGAAGLLVALWGIDALVALLPANLSSLNTIGLDARVLAIAGVVTLGTGVAFGLLPAAFATSRDFAGALRSAVVSGSTSAAGRRLRSIFLTAEVALALTLLIGAGLMLRSLREVQAEDPGFRTGSMLTAAVNLPAARYPDTERITDFYHQLIERLRSDGRLAAVSGVSILPLTGVDNDVGVTTDLRAHVSNDDRAPGVWYRQTFSDYFSVLGMRVVAGRGFSPADRADAPPVVIVNQAMANRHWPGGDAVGRQLKFGRSDSSSPWRTVVGVVADVRHRGLDQPAQEEMFLPFDQSPTGAMYLTLRPSQTTGDAATVLREHLAALDATLPLGDVATLKDRLSGLLGPRRVTVGLLSGFAMFALLLAAVGLYGVVAYIVGHRTREIGVRIALGATGRDVVRLVVGQGVRLTGLGIVLGLGAAVFLTRFLASMLYGVSPTDPATFMGVALVLGAVALIASYLPARRAARVQPMSVLRSD